MPELLELELLLDEPPAPPELPPPEPLLELELLVNEAPPIPELLVELLDVPLLSPLELEALLDPPLPPVPGQGG